MHVQPRADRATPRWRTPLAILASLAVVAAPLTLPAIASADVSGYLGTGDGAEAFDNVGGNRLLPIMTAGESYSASLTGPQPIANLDWCWSITGGELPDGIQMTVDGECAPSATFSGTPAAGGFSFELTVADTANETIYTLAFEGVVESGKIPTTTTLTVPAVSPYDTIVLTATVQGDDESGARPGGSVEFSTPGPGVVGTAALVGGVASVTVPLDKSNAGAKPKFTATYLGDEQFGPSISAAATTLLYVPTANGTVQWNGLGVDGAIVELLDASDIGIVVDVDVTGADGEFSLNPGPIATASDVQKLYIIRAGWPDGTVLFHKFGGTNVDDAGQSSTTGPSTWKNYLTVQRSTPPVWTDDTLATPRIGSVYNDAVAAASPNEVAYWVSAGALPTGLELSETTGALTGTPSCAPLLFSALGAAPSGCDYDFTVTAGNGHGTIVQRFTGTLLPAGVPPTWEDDTLGALQVGTTVDDGVRAVGDPAIVYAVTAGTLPAGLSLSSTTGAITGAPTASGPYEFTITASNAFGAITADFSGEVADRPELDLTLDFEEGTLLTDASTVISASGLRVGSTYTLTMYSSPRVLHTGTVDATGGFSRLVSLPADTPAGAHRLVLNGIAADGTAMQDEAWFSLRADGRIGAISYTGPVAGLAATGAEPFAATLGAGLLLLLGAGALALGRRRRQRA